ncbi:MAG: universal stress protein [Xanthomonadales bacterium]|nr:universal stress protein [Xanthomonadales bacterium]
MNTKAQVTHPAEEKELFHTSDPSPRHGIQHILVCLDGATDSAICIASALSLANTFDSTVTLVHVMQHHDDGFGPHTTDALGWEITRQEAKARLEQVQQEAAQKSGRRIGVRLEQGAPAKRIVALSRKLGSDLVVLGSHEQSDHPTWQLGCTAQQVLAASRSSVLIARGNGAPPTFVPPKRILVPLDGSPRTESVLPTAEIIAQVHGAQLVLVHIVAEPLRTGILSTPEDLQLARDLATRLEAQASRYLEALRHHVGFDKTQVVTHVERQPDKRQFLVELAAREKIDLIVLSAHGATCNPARPFGSMTAHLLTHSKVPLLILQDLPKSELPCHSESGERYAPPLRGTYPPDIA